MKVFVRFSVLISILFAVVSCGESDQASEFANRRDRRPGNGGETSAGRPVVNGKFPSSPEKSVTPGSVCERASELRYPEQIKYCNRDVDSTTKYDIFVNYDQKFGFETTKMERSSFKIDHLIPLCLGGSNRSDNLWPQHITIYQHTDPIEPFLCGVLAQGKIKQADAIQLILTIKQSPFSADDELRKLEAKY